MSSEQWGVDRRLAAQKNPLTASEKASGRPDPEDVRRLLTGETRDTTPSVIPKAMRHVPSSKKKSTGAEYNPAFFCKAVQDKLKDDQFMLNKDVVGNSAPLPMVAFATVVIEKIINNPNIDNDNYFDGLTMTVPKCQESYSNKEYHSIQGVDLHFVHWKKMMDIDIKCPCGGILQHDCSHFSKNKIIFPIFNLDGQPSWAIVTPMRCNGKRSDGQPCKNRADSNTGEILSRLPHHLRSCYPVEPKYALGNKNSHLGRKTTEILVDSLMGTYGNGDLIARMVFDVINCDYKSRVADWFSYNPDRKPGKYPDHFGEFITKYPSTGAQVRDHYVDSCVSLNNPWKVNDHDQNTREIVGVSKDGWILVIDHTFQTMKNYLYANRLGLKAMFTAAIQTGEIVLAVAVPSTKTADFSHDISRLSKRPDFKVDAVYTDTWPHKEGYWKKVFGAEFIGCLGLFHFMQRIGKTLRKNHINYNKAITGLTLCMYAYHKFDYNKLLEALMEGNLPCGKLRADEIEEMKNTPVFRDRYAKYLRKVILAKQTIIAELELWWNRYKCSSSTGEAPALGRRDPTTRQTLFTEDSKTALFNCKEKAGYIQDPRPIEEMYEEIKPHPNSKHGLSVWLSLRGESNLEMFHLMLAHFANNGMRESLVDNLNLQGTARHNMRIRHKRRLARRDMETRKKIPAGWETVVPFYNHSELAHINELAVMAGVDGLPFLDLEKLAPDNNDEYFFSEYSQNLKRLDQAVDNNDICICRECAPRQEEEPAVPMDEEPPRNEEPPVPPMEDQRAEGAAADNVAGADSYMYPHGVIATFDLRDDDTGCRHLRESIQVLPLDDNGNAIEDVEGNPIDPTIPPPNTIPAAAPPPPPDPPALPPTEDRQARPPVPPALPPNPPALPPAETGMTELRPRPPPQEPPVPPMPTPQQLLLYQQQQFQMQMQRRFQMQMQMQRLPREWKNVYGEPPPNWVFCCEKQRTYWLKNIIQRKGRPSHNKQCHVRTMAKTNATNNSII